MQYNTCRSRLTGVGGGGGRNRWIWCTLARGCEGIEALVNAFFRSSVPFLLKKGWRKIPRSRFVFFFL